MAEKNCDNCANEFCAFIPPDGKAYCDRWRSNVPAVNRWISVEDALPEIKEFHISDTVLCYCDSGVLAIARLEENGFGQVGFNCEKDEEYHTFAGKVLYWMPIPEIPEKE